MHPQELPRLGVDVIDIRSSCGTATGKTMKEEILDSIRGSDDKFCVIEESGGLIEWSRFIPTGQSFSKIRSRHGRKSEKIATQGFYTKDVELISMKTSLEILHTTFIVMSSPYSKSILTKLYGSYSSDQKLIY
jgi:hypothetical protein